MKTGNDTSCNTTSFYDNFQTPMQINHIGAGDLETPRDLEMSSLLKPKNLPPIGRRRHSTSALHCVRETPNDVASCSPSNEQEIIFWFHSQIIRKMRAGAFLSALAATSIMIFTLFLAKFSVYSPIYSFIAILSPLLHPTMVAVTILLFFVGNLANSYVLSLVYRHENFRPSLSGDESIFGSDLMTLKLKITVAFTMAVINSVSSCVVWTYIVKHGEFDRSMCSSLFIGTIVTSTFIVFYRKNYMLVFRSIKAPIEKRHQFFHFSELYGYFHTQEILHFSQKSWQATLFAQIAQNVGIWIIDYLPFLSSLASDVDAQFHFLLFNFAHILTGLYFHKFIDHFILEPITFIFPEKYEIANPSVEQKANIRNALLCSDDFFKMYAFLDLVYLSTEASSLRRQLVFELSVPGNNPLNWTTIRNACIAQITKLITELKDARQRLGVALYEAHNDDEDSFNQSMLLMNPAQRTQMYSMSVRRRQHASLRRMAVPVVKHSTVIAKTYISPYMARNVIMAIEAIVNLIICSLKEDRFGIVQKDRPVILRSILQLSAVIDKYSREKKATSMDDGINSEWIQEVEDVISRSVIAFHSPFKKYISSFGLSPEEHRLYSQLVFRRIYE